MRTRKSFYATLVLALSSLRMSTLYSVLRNGVSLKMKLHPFHEFNITLL